MIVFGVVKSNGLTGQELRSDSICFTPEQSMRMIEDREFTNYRLNRCMNEKEGYINTMKRVLVLTDSLELEAGYYNKAYNDCIEGNNKQVTEIVNLRYKVKARNKWIIGLAGVLVGSLSINYFLLK